MTWIEALRKKSDEELWHFIGDKAGASQEVDSQQEKHVSIGLTEVSLRSQKRTRDSLDELRGAIDRFDSSSQNYSRKIVFLTWVLVALTFVLVIPIIENLSHALLPAWHGIMNHLDRILALIAVVIAAGAMIDVRRLFKELEGRDRTTEKRVRQAVLKELLTHTSSFAAFSRAAQFIDFDKNQPDKQAAIAMLMSFRFQQLLAPDAKKEELAQLRQTTRNAMEETAREYAETIISSGIGKLKDGWDFSQPPK
jgi:hypothetical protein